LNICCHCQGTNKPRTTCTALQLHCNTNLKFVEGISETCYTEVSLHTTQCSQWNVASFFNKHHTALSTSLQSNCHTVAQ